MASQNELETGLDGLIINYQKDSSLENERFDLNYQGLLNNYDDQCINDFNDEQEKNNTERYYKFNDQSFRISDQLIMNQKIPALNNKFGESFKITPNNSLHSPIK